MGLLPQAQSYRQKKKKNGAEEEEDDEEQPRLTATGDAVRRRRYVLRHGSLLSPYRSPYPSFGGETQKLFSFRFPFFQT